MKKKILLYLSLTSLISLTSLTRLAFAEVSTQSAQELQQQIEKKVVEIAKNYQRPLNGKISSLGAKTIALTTLDGNKTIYVSEATLYFRIRSGSRSSIELKSLKTGEDISALGTVDPATSELSAKQIIAKVKREILIGEITDQNLTKGLFTVDKTPLEVELTTPIKIASGGAILKGKYADLKTAPTLAVTGYYDDAKTFIPLKILILN